MSLRLRLSLAIAAVAALVAAGIGFAVYDRAVDERLDTARRGVAEDVRRNRPAANTYGPIYSGMYLEYGARQEGAVTLRDRIPPELRDAVRNEPGRVFTVVLRGGDDPTVIGGTSLRDGGALFMQRRFGQDEAALRNLRRAIIQIVIGAALLGALVGALVAALISQPLRRAVALARRLADGDLQARLKPKGNNEIAELGRALDDMADALGTKLAELDQAAERERRFSADVAHELRTPITGLVAAASLLDDSPEGSMVRERASALAALVEDLLEVMRLESGSEEVRVERFDLVHLVRDVAAQRAPDALIDAPAGLMVASDPRRVERVLANLLDNAVRHGQPPVCVIVRRDGTVTVRDYGDGFGPFLDRAGERFAMASSSRSGGGTGLGLAIAHGQARLLGGELELVDADGAVATLHLHVNGQVSPERVDARVNRRPVQVAVLALLAIAGVLAACGTASLGVRDEGNAGTASASIPVNEVSVSVPGPERTVVGPEVTVTVPQEETSEETSAATVPALPTEEEAQRPAVVYLYRYGRPEAVAVDGSSVDSTGRSLLDGLLAPLTPAEKSLRFTSAIPEGTAVRSYVESEGTASVDLSSEFAQASPRAIYQLVYTLTTRPALRQVDISVDGVPFDLGGGLTGPVTRELADVLVRAPATATTTLEGQPCDPATAPPAAPGQAPFVLAFPRDTTKLEEGEPLRLTGVMRLPDEVLVFRVIQYRTEVAHAISEQGCEGRFEWTMELPAGLTGPVTLEAYSPAQEGTKRWQTVRRLEIQ